jgi:spermidine/putrescine transport system permease protein
MAVLFILSLSADGLIAFPPESITLKWYFAIFTDPAALSAIKNSLIIGVGAVITTIVFAMLFAIGLDRLEFELKTTALYIIVLPLIIPGIVGGVAVFQFAEFLGISGIFVVIAVHVVVTLPYATLIILETLSNYNRSFEEASMNLGANEIETFRQVTLPNIKNGVIAASLLVFTFSFNEFIFTYFVRGDSFQTLPIYLWGQTYQGISPIVNSVSVLFMVVATTMVLAAVLATNVRKVSRV